MKKILFTIVAGLSLSYATAQQNLGLGTNDPKSKVDVKGGITVGGNYSGTYSAPANGAIIEGAVGIGTNNPHPSAILDLSANQKGLLTPRMSTAQRMAMTGVPKGLLVFDTDINNFFYHDGNVWLNVSTSGIQGPQGPNGPTGAQGSIGNAGPQGAPGNQGAAGPQGAIGPQGDPGAAGPQGAQGPQGIAGPQGAAGPQGSAGPQGAAGPQGLAGPQGAQGAAGPQGVAGPQGAQGPQGPQGVAGPQGAQGAAGPQGAQGGVGPQGAQGPQGVAGPQGAQGPAGAQGAQGAQGSVTPGSAAGNTAYWNGSAWANGSNLYNNGGNIGIGSTSPQAKLQIEGDKLYLSKTSFPNTGSWTVADLNIGSNTETRDGYSGTNGPQIILRSSSKSAIAVLDENNDLGQISYQGLSWNIGENIGWGNQNIKIPALSGGGNKIIQADNNGQLYASNDVSSGDGSYIQNQYSGPQSANLWISGIGRANNGVVTGTSGTYNTFYTWTDLVNPAGFYSSVHNGAHFSPNELTFGSWRIRGNRNTWQGLEFDAAGGNLSLMMGTTGQGLGNQIVGIHNNSVGNWLWRFEHQRLWADGLTDINDGGYYINPNGGSNIISQVSNSLSTKILDLRHVSGNSGQSNHYYAIFQEGGAWTHPYPDLRIAYHTGIKLGANQSYNGVRFFTDWDMSGLVMSVNDGSTSGPGNVMMTGQLGVGGAPHPSAALTVTSTNKGFYLPRMTTAQRDAIGTKPNGLMLYNTTTNCSQFWGGGSGWVNMACSYTPGSAVLGYTAGVQTWTVPSGVSTIKITAYGAQGGTVPTGVGGQGGVIQANIGVSAGQTLYIYVGGQGGNSGGGFNGGGNGGNATNSAGGGGASDVRIGGTALGNRVIVAGGGGGGGLNCGGQVNGGGAGGAATGGTGFQCSSPTSYVGTGGTQSGGGIAGNNQGQGCGTNGSAGIGGNGACTYGGGGGGGYFGGGGGGYGGGGGGSNYSSGSIIYTQQGGRLGSGLVIIEW